jgi:hypothetical protein
MLVFAVAALRVKAFRGIELSPSRLNGLLSAGNAAEQAGLPEQARVLPGRRNCDELRSK